MEMQSSPGARRCSGRGMSTSPARYRPRQRSGVRANVVRRAAGHEVPAVLARAGPQIHYVVRRFDGLPVVFDDDDRVAHVAQAAQRIQKAAVVALVQADARLIEHVQDAHQAGSDLARQPDPLALAPGERARGPVQREVVQPHLFEKLEPLDDFLQNPFRNEVVAIRAVLRFKKGAHVLDAHGG